MFFPLNPLSETIFHLENFNLPQAEKLFHDFRIRFSTVQSLALVKDDVKMDASSQPEAEDDA